MLITFPIMNVGVVQSPARNHCTPVVMHMMSIWLRVNVEDELSQLADRQTTGKTAI